MINRDQISELFSQAHRDAKGSILCVSEGDRQHTWASDFSTEQVVNVYSISKLIVALAVYAAWERGVIDFDKSVSHYWPAFAQEGKEAITVRHVMEHSSGVPHFGVSVSTADTYDWHRVCSVLAGTRPLHRAGEQTIYHARTFGFLLGEVIRRATGCSLPDFVHETLSTAHSEFYLGVPDDVLHRVRPLSVPADLEVSPGAYRASGAKPIPEGAAPYAATVFQNPVNNILAPNDPAWLKAVLPSSGGVSNAPMIVDIMRSFFAKYPHSRGEIKSLTENGFIAAMDLALGFPVTWAGGFEANNGEFGIAATRLGYRAIGGSIAFFDLHRDLFVAYTTSMMIAQPGLHPAHDPRIERVLDVL